MSNNENKNETKNEAKKGKDRNNSELSLDEWARIIEECRRLGLSKVALSGGEPLCHNDAFEILAMIKSAGMRIKLNTSGWHIDEKMAVRLKESGVSVVQISVLSSKPRLHDSLKGKKGSHARALEAMRNCKTAGLTTLFSTIALRQNISDVPAMAKLCDEIGAYLYVKRFHPAGRASMVKDFAPSREDYRKMLIFLKGYYGKELTNAFEKYLRALKGSCLAGLSLCVSSEGKVFPCAEMHIEIGDLRRENIEEIWRRAWLGAPCASIRKREGLSARCVGCSTFDRCGGGCRADAYGFTGVLFGEDPYCWRLGRDEARCGDDVDDDLPPMLNMLGMYFGWLGDIE